MSISSESALHHDALSPAYKSAALCCCGICCQHRSNAFPWRNNPQKCPSAGGSGPPPSTWLLQPTQVHNPNGTSIGSAGLAKHTVVLNRQTDRHADRPLYICSNRPHLCTQTVRPTTTAGHTLWADNCSMSSRQDLSLLTAH